MINSKRSKDLISLNEPNSFIAESYKMFRTNINYLNINGKNQVLMLTSSMSEEGKTTTICNLAVTMAKDNKKVLLIECDLRRPRVHELFKVNQIPGLTNIIYDNLILSEIIQRVDNVDGLDILTSGVIPLQASELLNSAAFKNIIQDARNLYDVILIDTPPLLSVTDAAIISLLVDGVILTVAANQTKKSVISKSYKVLNNINSNVLGVVLTKMDNKKHNKYYNDSYYNLNNKYKPRNWIQKLMKRAFK
ncbi:MAG: capsular biosynthesis protein [Firmicutes bacterium HGW-Firmicutes-7]|nr:MAG: capsular biosynthesis protein [Firmicutes bacterium HGW-Firmicutes-7]